MKLISSLLITGVLLTGCLYKKAEFKYVNIEFNDTLRSKKTMKLNIVTDIMDEEVFRTAKGCICDFSFGKRGPSSLTCMLPNGYRTQITLNCKINNSRETAAGGFICKNIYMWCS